MTIMQRHQTYYRDALEAKMDLAEEVLHYSDRNIQLTMEILIQTTEEIGPLLLQQAENSAMISTLVQNIREQVECEMERELLDVASACWPSAHSYAQSLHRLVDRQRHVAGWPAMANMILPLLLDNTSWRAYVQFLRAQTGSAELNKEMKRDLANRASAFVRENQELKSTVAERKRIAEKLSQLASIVECSNDAIIIHTLDGMIVSWNVGAESVYGYSAWEVLGKPRNVLVPNEQPDELAGILKTLDRGEKIQLYETVHVRKDGHRIDVSMMISPVKDASEQVVGVATITRDISERKKAEERFYKAFNATPEPITIANFADGRFVDVNETFLRATGFDREEVIGRTSLELEFWDRPEDCADLIEALKKHGSVRDMEITFRAKSGERRTGLNSAEVIDIAGQKCVLAIFKDITNQKILGKQRELAEAELALRAAELSHSNTALRQSEASFRSLVFNSPYAIFRSSLDGMFLDANPALLDMLGYTSVSEIVAHGLSANVCGEPRERLLEYFNCQKRFRDVEVGWKRKDGKSITVSLTGRPVRNEEGKLTHFEVIGEEITARKALEAQFRQAQKMESIGRLSGGIAHDFNNLLGVIIGYCGVLEERADVDTELRKGVQEIKKAGQRAAALTRQLLAFSRQQMLEPRVLNLNNVVADMGKMLPRLIGEDIELSTVLQPELGRVKADQGQIEQVIMNLAVNARDAMPRGGKLIIETADVELDESYGQQHPPTIPGQYILLAVTDTGVGMDKETQSHMFEPFFTTKEKDKGTGLGLSVVYGVVKQSGGYIWVCSEPGNGTTFKIYLPSVKESVEKVGPQDVPAKSLKGSETILLVEDEESLRSLICSLLVHSGYTVLDTNSGVQALKIAHEHRGGIHLLLTDMVLPGISGVELAQEMTWRYSNVKVLFMSGYTAYASASQGALKAGTFLLQKPFEPEGLRSRVRGVLDTAFTFAPSRFPEPAHGQADRKDIDFKI
jgi:two-component system, cell cycle sensor histidine kinase and response regulator CckA